jgi:catechol 2,3-dioxygenase-like lactoylglutathione lyase family enzyme
MLKISGLDHLVLTVQDIDTSVVFYVTVLGMQHETYGGNRHALKFGKQKINLHQAGREFEPRAARPVPGSADLCLVTSTPLADAMAHVQACGVEIMQGPVHRTCATGTLLSFYIRDPDHNLIEIANRIPM